jgi:Family of unknown function (DUF5906)
MKRVKPIGHEGVTFEDFYAFMPTHHYIFAPCREMWPASSVNARIKPFPVLTKSGKAVRGEDGKPKQISATTKLDRERSVELMTWAPGEEMIIRDRLISHGGWFERKGVACFNLYRPPTLVPGDGNKAGRWLRHVQRIYEEEEVDHIIKWLAHRVQRPWEKINHALVLAGAQGIGKDSIVEPVKRAVGPWNVVEVSPKMILARFNGFVKSVIMRINEARDLGDIDRFQFYEHLKPYTAAPPDVLRVDEKNLKEHNVLNCCGVIITTNYKTDGIYLPADDRRHHVAWSDLTKDDFDDDYWQRLWGWYDDGGDRHVMAYLSELDIGGFNPKAPPPKTPAFWDIVNAHRAPEESEMADAIDKLGKPNALTLAMLIEETNDMQGRDEFHYWLRDRKNRRVIPHRLERGGYVAVQNDTAKDGLWVIDGRRQVVYAKCELSLSDRHKAANRLTNGPPNRRSVR